MSHIEHITYDRRWHSTSSILNFKTIIKWHVWIFFKKMRKCSLGDSKRYNYAFSAFAQTWNGWESEPVLTQGETTTWKNGDGLRKIRIKFPLIKKTNLGVAYALFHP